MRPVLGTVSKRVAASLGPSCPASVLAIDGDAPGTPRAHFILYFTLFFEVTRFAAYRNVPGVRTSQLTMAANHSQQIIEIMFHASSEATERFHVLRLPELPLELLPVLLDEASNDPCQSNDCNLFLIADKNHNIVALNSTGSMLAASAARTLLETSLAQRETSTAQDIPIWQLAAACGLIVGLLHAHTPAKSPRLTIFEEESNRPRTREIGRQRAMSLTRA